MEEYDEIIDKLTKEYEVEKLLSFNETNIKEKLSENSNKIWMFTELYQKEKNKYNKILELKEKVIGDRYNFYKTKHSVLLKQNEIEKYYLPKDEHITRVNEILNKQMIFVEFYDNIRKALEKQSWNMQTFLKSMTYGV